MNLTDSLKKFKIMLQKLPDNPINAFEFYSFFKSLPMVDSESIPFIELGTILKHKKPSIFFELRKQFSHNKVIHIVTTVDMDLNEAETTIAKMIDSKK